MAYNYKQIGTSAAKVVSVFAVVGGLLWWQRTGQPTAPRPQDEAETMTAIVERYYAMTETNFQFVVSNAANVAQVLQSVITLETNVFVSITSSIIFPDGTGTNCCVVNDGYDGLHTGCAFPSGLIVRKNDLVSETGVSIPDVGGCGAWTAWFADPYYDYCGSTLTIRTGYGGYILAYLPGDSYIYGWSSAVANPAFPCSLSPSFAGFTGTITIAEAYTTIVPVTNVVAVCVTNAPATVLTNTIGHVPNAPARYPASIRTAITPWGNDYHWMIPSNSFMASGDWSGDYSGYSNSVIKWLDSDPAWWTNWVTRETATWTTSSNYWQTNLVPQTNIVISPPSTNVWTKTNVLLSVSNVVHTTNVNCWIGSGTPYTIPAKAFAFERDSKSLYWSTNVYNDMARALSLMQWVGTTGLVWESAPTNYTYSYSCTINSNGPPVFSLNTNWVASTNAVTDSGAEINVSLRCDAIGPWGNENDTYPGGYYYTGQAYPNDIGVHWTGYPEMPAWAWTLTISGYIRGMRPRATFSSTNFALTNVTIYSDNFEKSLLWVGDVTNNNPAQTRTGNDILCGVATNAETYPTGPGTNSVYAIGGWLWNPTNQPPTTNWIQSQIVDKLPISDLYDSQTNQWIQTWEPYQPNIPSTLIIGYMQYYFLLGEDLDYGWKSAQRGYGTGRYVFGALTNYPLHAPPR